MTELDINNLSLENIKLLNKISENLKLEFHSLIEELFISQKNNKFLLLNEMYSRNSYRSNLFFNLCILELIDQLIKKNHSIKKIICSDMVQMNILKKRFKKINFTCKRSFDFLFINEILNFLKILNKVFFI